MKKSKYYYKCKFSIDTVKRAHDQFLALLDNNKKIGDPINLRITRNNEAWNYDTFEEFISEYNNADSYQFDYIVQEKRLIIAGDKAHSYVSVESNQKKEIESVFKIFESKVDESTIATEKEPINIFIGHGHDGQWKELKDYLHEKQGFKINAYEIGPRAGLTIKEVLESMLNESSFALLVMTGENIDSEGRVHARENVIHELGLFQGRLGFMRAIPVLEKGVIEFSNILDLNQVRFTKGNIKEAIGEILSIIKREFE